MNKFFIASAIALTSLVATAAPSLADDGYYRHHRHYDHGDWGHYRHRHDRDCFTKKMVGWHHGHRVVTVERVCR